MQRITRNIGLALVAGSALIVATNGLAQSTQKKEPAAARYYPFVGAWQGQGEFTEPGQAPVKLTLSLSCRKVSAGWAVACDMFARSNTMVIAESDLFGVDPLTGRGHWYAITNQGETHDHLVEWDNAQTMKARYAWTEDGRRMQESVEFSFKGTNALTFRSVVSADGKPVAQFSGSLKH